MFARMSGGLFNGSSIKPERREMLSLSLSCVWKMFSYNNLDRGPLSSSCSYSSFYRPGWWYIKKLSSFIFIIVKNFICCVFLPKKKKKSSFFSAQCISLALKELSLHEWRNDNSGRKTFIICGIAELCLYLLPSHSWLYNGAIKYRWDMQKIYPKMIIIIIEKRRSLGT